LHPGGFSKDLAIRYVGAVLDREKGASLSQKIFAAFGGEMK
jgi:hypothetical protein